MDGRDGDDHVEDLLEREVLADLTGALRGGEQRAAGTFSGAAAHPVDQLVAAEVVPVTELLELSLGDLIGQLPDRGVGGLLVTEVPQFVNDRLLVLGHGSAPFRG